jgi:ArsR family transcriptional regulator, arsenate/arsenite/antimonite-responsive transcriptional repressor
MEASAYDNISNELSSLLAALAHPARLQILLHLAKYNDCHAGSISEQLPLVKSTVSEHLSKLKKAGLITCNPDGICLNYRISDAGIDLLKGKLGEFITFIDLWKQKRTGCLIPNELSKWSINNPNMDKLK